MGRNNSQARRNERRASARERRRKDLDFWLVPSDDRRHAFIERPQNDKRTNDEFYMDKQEAAARDIVALSGV